MESPHPSARHHEAEPPSSTAVPELLRLLVKTLKARRLYQGGNDVSERLERELFRRWSAHLETFGAVNLTIREFQILSEDAVVYESLERKDSLAFLFYRDGVRRLSFHPGLEQDELHALLDCLNRVARLANDQDDLVTLLWEREFHAIRYFAIEEIASNDSFPRLDDQLASGELSGEGGHAPEMVSLELEQPVTMLPVDSCRLNDDDLAALHAELASEERLSFPHLVSEIAIELTLLEDGDEEREKLREELVAILDGFVSQGRLEEAVALHEHLEGLAAMVFADEPPVGRLAAGISEALVNTERLETFLHQVERLSRPKPDTLTAYLARLGSAVTPRIVPWMGRFSSRAYRRAATNALMARPEEGLRALAAHLAGASSAAPVHRDHLREIVHALSRSPGEGSLALLEKLLRGTDPETRRVSFLVLSRFPQDRVGELSLELLEDPDPELRSAALDALVRRGKEEIGPKTLSRVLDSACFERWSASEKRRFFAAVAKLSGDTALEPFRRILQKTRPAWFASRNEKQLAAAAAHGLRTMGTGPALEVLEKLARTGFRWVRSVCRKELESVRSMQGTPPGSGSRGGR